MKSKNNDPIINDLLQWLNQAPTAWHATESTVMALQQQGFQELKEGQPWSLKPEQRYFITRNGSSLCAFITPKHQPESVRLLASHSDSPGLKLKPQPEIRKQDMILFGAEVYGSPLLSSWLNRDLGLAGRVIFYNSKNQIQSQLIKLEEDPFLIPQLAIHLDREVNEKGLLLNKQEHLNVLAALYGPATASQPYLELLLQKKIDLKQLINFDLFFYPLEQARYVGYQQQMISSYRIDNLASLHATLQAFTKNAVPLEKDIKMLVCWDHEEIGSNTTHGASSPFLSQTLERILLSYNLGREDYFRIISKSLCVSIDMAHALNPNYMEKHDLQHPIQLGKGIVLKINAQQRYATDALSSLAIQVLAKNHKIPLQKFVSRNDIPSGTTIGPIHAALTGMPSVDIGCSQLSMHSCRELMSCEDHMYMYQLLSALLEAPALPQIEPTSH